MRTDRIDFISAYCDRWCERCRFTARCATFAAASELAAGAPPAAGEPCAGEQPSEEPAGVPARRGRTDHPTAGLAGIYTMLAHRWLRAEREAWGHSADPIVREAIEVIAWDHILIGAKIRRALESRNRQSGDDHPIQNDANGSAKVALISLERSTDSWRLIAQATGGEVPLMMADHLAQLRSELEREFPDARGFRRPGFDDEPVDG